MPSFDYTSRDYLSIRQDLLDRASSLIPEWSSRSSSDFGTVLVDLWAYMGDILHYYVDRAAAETYLGTAVNASSVRALANLFDYRPANQTSSIGLVTVSANDPNHSNTLVIPANTGFVAPATDNSPIVYFTSTSSASMGPSISAVTIQVAEGKYESNEQPIQAVTRTTYSNGTAGQRFNLRYTGVVVSSLVVNVAEGPTYNGSPSNVQYLYTSNLSLVSADSKVFTVEIASDGVAQIIFGNGINGKIPANRAEVTVSYRRGQGSGGNISEGRINFFDADSTVEGVSVTSSTATTGGTDFESIDSMKVNIPLMFRTQDRAVSLQDFKDLALRVPQVVKATCVATGSNIMVYGLPDQPNYLSESSTSLTVPTFIKDQIVTYFAPRTLVGASVGAANAVTLTPVNITATVAITDNYVANWVGSAVSDAIDSFFTFDKVSFGQTLSIGSLYKAIQSIEGVEYVTITVFSTSGSGTSNTLTAGSSALFRKGTVSLSTSGGITGAFT